MQCAAQPMILASLQRWHAAAATHSSVPVLEARLASIAAAGAAAAHSALPARGLTGTDCERNIDRTTKDVVTCLRAALKCLDA